MRRFRSFWSSTLKSPPAASSLSQMASMDSATIVLRTAWLAAQFCEEPGARNSNLLPVKANGEVLLRSVTSLGIGGMVSTPILIAVRPVFFPARPVSISFITAERSSPRKTEMTAGGASFAPRRWSFPAPAVELRRRSEWRSIALMTAERNVRNIALSRGLSPGERRFLPP